MGINDWTAAGQPPGTGGNGGWFESLKGERVRELSKNPNHGGVVGVNTAGGWGVLGQSDSGHGVFAETNDGIGVLGESKNNEGVRGIGHSARAAIVGINDWAAAGQPPGTGGNGDWFESLQGEGVRGWSKNPKSWGEWSGSIPRVALGYMERVTSPGFLKVTLKSQVIFDSLTPTVPSNSILART